MSRLSRKNRTDIIIKGHGGITDAFDDAIKETWRIDDDEYDYIAEFADDEILDLLVSDMSLLTITEKKRAITLINNKIDEYKNSDDYARN